MPISKEAWLIVLVIGILVVLPFKFLFDLALWQYLSLAVPVGLVVTWIGMFIMINRQNGPFDDTFDE